MTVQRDVWVYDGTNWKSKNRPQQAPVASSELLGLAGARNAPTNYYGRGDRFDDQAGQYYSARNAKISPYGDGTTPDQEMALRDQIAEGKRWVQVTLHAVERVLEARGARGVDGVLKAAMSSAFPFTRLLSDQVITQEVLPHVQRVLQAVADGLASKDVEFAMVGTGSWNPLKNMMIAEGGSTGGWVGAPVTRTLFQSYSESAIPPVEPLSGPIHLTRQPGDNPWFVIHEATHRFAGTLDYQYSPRGRELDTDKQLRHFEAELGKTDPPPGDLVKQALESSVKGAREEFGARRPGDPSGFDPKTVGDRQPAQWYAMGRRALMNADSYAQLCAGVLGEPLPNLPDTAPHDHAGQKLGPST